MADIPGLSIISPCLITTLPCYDGRLLMWLLPNGEVEQAGYLYKEVLKLRDWQNWLKESWDGKNRDASALRASYSNGRISPG